MQCNFNVLLIGGEKQVVDFHLPLLAGQHQGRVTTSEYWDKVARFNS